MNGLSPFPRQVRWDLPADPSITAKCRAMVRDTLDGWGLRDLVDDVVLVVGELLANAVLYGTAPIEVALSAYPGMLVGTVADHGMELPYMRVAEPGDEHGRGLAIVDGLVHKWGVRLLPDGRGKCVWFVCLIPSEWLDLAVKG